MSQQKWNFSGIEAGSVAIQSSVTATENLHDEGKASLLKLADAWGGSGSDAYQVVQQRWDDTSAELNASLRELAKRISEAGQNMGQTENKIQNRFNR